MLNNNILETREIQVIEPEPKNKSGREMFLETRELICKKVNRSERAYNQLDDDAKYLVLNLANKLSPGVFTAKDTDKKFNEFTVKQRRKIIQALSNIQKSFRSVPRWLSEADAL